MKQTILSFIFILVLIITGCSSSVPKDSVKVSPSKLFQGDAERLAPHFDMIPGCIKVDYKGNKKSINLKYEIWKNGELQESHNAASTFFEDGKFNGEVSISITRDVDHEENPNNLKIKTFISELNNGFAGVTQHVDGFEASIGYGAVELQESITINDNEEVTIWGLKAYEGAYNTRHDDIEENIKAADWGLILKVFFNTESDDEIL